MFEGLILYRLYSMEIEEFEDGKRRFDGGETKIGRLFFDLELRAFRMGKTELWETLKIVAQTEYLERTGPCRIDDKDDELFSLEVDFLGIQVQTLFAGIEDVAKVSGIVDKAVDGGMVGKVDINVQLGIGKGEMGEPPGTVFGLFKLFGVHQDDKFGLGDERFDMRTHTRAHRAIAGIAFFSRHRGFNIHPQTLKFF